MKHPHDEDACCEVCSWYVPLDATITHRHDLGECRKRSAGAYKHRYDQSDWPPCHRWPDVLMNDWCGEFIYRYGFKTYPEEGEEPQPT